MNNQGRSQGQHIAVRLCTAVMSSLKKNIKNGNLVKATFCHGTYNKNVKVEVEVTDHRHEMRKEAVDQMSTRSQNC